MGSFYEGLCEVFAQLVKLFIPGSSKWSKESDLTLALFIAFITMPSLLLTLLVLLLSGTWIWSIIIAIHGAAVLVGLFIRLTLPKGPR